MSIGRRILVEIERTIYVIAGLPIALQAGGHSQDPAAQTIRYAFARRYWRPRRSADMVELVLGIIIAPLAVPLAALWFTLRNGSIVREREGKGLGAQFLQQLRLYQSAGIIGPWYYILSLHRDGERRAPTFLQRCETKFGIYPLLRPVDASPLGKKDAFAKHCSDHHLPCVPILAALGDGQVNPAAFPDCDLFVKPLRGRGGKGAERWDRIDHRTWSNGPLVLKEGALLAHLRSRQRALLVQPYVHPHSELVPLTSGALPTVRALTCLNESGDPEVVATVFRMSVGSNRTVDNIHAGGLACRASIKDGVLGPASDLGANTRVGWHSRHPTTGALIEGTRLPFWFELKALAVRAHRAFADRVIIGWDIAITNNGPVIVEGNGGPDMDLMQRFMETGFCHRHRFGELLAHHLTRRGFDA